MNEIIAEAIEKSIKEDRIVHCAIPAGGEWGDMYDALAGACPDDWAVLGSGDWDVWGHSDETEDEWRIQITPINDPNMAGFNREID